MTPIFSVCVVMPTPGPSNPANKEPHPEFFYCFYQSEINMQQNYLQFLIVCQKFKKKIINSILPSARIPRLIACEGGERSSETRAAA